MQWAFRDTIDTVTHMGTAGLGRCWRNWNPMAFILKDIDTFPWAAALRKSICRVYLKRFHTVLHELESLLWMKCGGKKTALWTEHPALNGKSVCIPACQYISVIMVCIEVYVSRLLVTDFWWQLNHYFNVVWRHCFNPFRMAIQLNIVHVNKWFNRRSNDVKVIWQNYGREVVVVFPDFSVYDTLYVVAVESRRVGLWMVMRVCQSVHPLGLLPWQNVVLSYHEWGTISCIWKYTEWHWCGTEYQV